MNNGSLPRIFQALSPIAITRISQLADWLWEDHEEHAVQTPNGPHLPTAIGTSERNALLAFIAALPTPAIAELFALSYVGAVDRKAGQAMEIFCAMRNMHLDTPEANVQVEVARILANMPLAQNLRRGLALLAVANLTAQTVH